MELHVNIFNNFKALTKVSLFGMFEDQAPKIPILPLVSRDYFFFNIPPAVWFIIHFQKWQTQSHKYLTQCVVLGRYLQNIFPSKIIGDFHP